MTPNKSTGDKKTPTNTPLSIVAITGYGLSFISFLIILIISCRLNLIKYDFSYIGFNDFQNIFSFPIKLAIATTTILGLILAYNKYNQDSFHFKEQFKQQNDNIKINNYYFHMNEFIMSVEFMLNDLIDNERFRPLLPINLRNDTMMKEFEKFSRKKITKHFTAHIYKVWFGHLHHSNLHIRKTVLTLTENLFNKYLSLDKNILPSTPDNLYKIQPFVKELGLDSILLNTNSEISNIYVYLIFRICKHILDFDHKEIKNQIELYERLQI